MLSHSFHDHIPQEIIPGCKVFQSLGPMSYLLCAFFTTSWSSLAAILCFECNGGDLACLIVMDIRSLLNLALFETAFALLISHSCITALGYIWFS